MKYFVITTVETATGQYTILASSEEEAKERLKNGSWDVFRDLGHDDCEIINVEEAT